MAKKRQTTAQAPQPDVLERYRKLLGEEQFAEMLAALQVPLPQAFRANPLKVRPEQAVEDWTARYGWQVQPVPFCPTGWQVTQGGTPLSATIEFRMGEYYIQDAASMLPAELLDFDGLDEPLVLDLAAAPGGKTTHLVSRAGDRGLVLGNDSSPGRIAALRGVLRDWGAVHAAVTNFPGERFGGWFAEKFDRVLLDAPCSMENLRPSGSHPRRWTSEREREQLSQRQQRLLASALQAVKVGGQVVYSTCTLAPEEDEGVLDGLLRQFPDAFTIESLAGKLPLEAPGLEGDEQRQFGPDVRRAARLWPHSFGTSGFFAALLRKTAPVSSSSQEPPERSLEKVGWQRLGRKETTEIESIFREKYSFDLLAVSEGKGAGLWRRGVGGYAVPESYMRHFGGLPAEGLGLLVGEDSPGGFVLSHEWAARFGREFQGGIYPLEADQLAAWMRGEDLQGAPRPGFAAGQIVVAVDPDGRIFGRGKVQGQRVKNLLPRRLV